MTLDIDLVTKLLDRYGLPTIILGAIFLTAYKLVVGPVTRLAVALAEGATTLAKSASTFLANLTASLEKSRVEHVEMRLHVTAEAVAVREHVSDELGRIRDTLSNEVRAATITGQFAAVSTRTPPMGLLATAKVDSHKDAGEATLQP
jgi:hypothetical protein